MKKKLKPEIFPFYKKNKKTPPVTVPAQEKEKKTAVFAPGEFSALLWSRLLLLLSGVWGVLFYIFDLDNTVCQMLPVLFAACCTGAVLWYLFYHFRRIALWLTAAALAGCVIAFALLSDVVTVQIAHIADIVQGYNVTETLQITEAMVIFAVLLTIGAFYLEFVLGAPAVFFALTVILVLFGPLAGLHAGIFTILILGAYQVLAVFSFWQNSRHAEAQKKNGKVFLKNGLFTAGVFAAAFLILWPAASAQSSFFYGAVSRIQGSPLFNRNSGAGSQQIIGGGVSRGNNYPTGRNQLRIVLDQKPQESLYLKCYTGAAYTGSGWEEADETNVLKEVARDLHMGTDQDYLAYTLGDMYFFANRFSEHIKDPKVRRMYLYAVSGTDESSGGGDGTGSRSDRMRQNGVSFQDRYRPYFSSPFLMENDGEEDEESSQEKKQREKDAIRPPSYYYYEETQMDVDWEHTRKNYRYPEYFTYMRRLQGVYLRDSRSMYTSVPENILPRLTRLCKDNPQTGLDDITSFILYTLHSNATYTRTPGFSSLNKDAVESFLFEKKRGYCVHFASAATLMYRMYGVSARYAAGYLAQPEDFKKRKDGTWIAELTDESAHSWTEIFLDGYGWTPVDMTPAAGNTSAVSYPGFNTQRLNTVMNSHHWRLPGADNRKAREKLSAGKSGKNRTHFHVHVLKTIRKHPKISWVVLALLLYTACMFPFRRDYRRMRRLERLNARQIFALLLEMMHRYGCMSSYNGNERDFADAFAQRFARAGVTAEESRKMTEIVRRAAFSKKEPGRNTGKSVSQAAASRQRRNILSEQSFSGQPAPDEEILYVRMVYQKAAAFLRGELGPWRRFVFRYFRMYG